MIGRLLVLGAFLAGVAAFFLPMFNVNMSLTDDPADKPMVLSASVMQLFQGEAFLESIPGSSEIPVAQKDAINSSFKQYRTALLIPFVPTALFLIILLVSIKRFGRGAGIFALIVGLLAVAGWGLITGVASDQPANAASLGIALTLVLVGGALGLVGGIAGIAKPELRKV